MCKCEKRARTKAKRANKTKPDDLPFVIKDNQITRAKKGRVNKSQTMTKKGKQNEKMKQNQMISPFSDTYLSLILVSCPKFWP